MTPAEPGLPLVDVVDVRPLTGHVLELTFTTGETGPVDVGDLLWGPVFEEIQADPAVFRAVRVDPDAGTIVWPNGADLAPDILYARYRKRAHGPQ